MRVETASQRQPTGLREISGFFFGTDPAVCGRSEKTEVREIKGCGVFLVVLFCWYSWNLLISNWLCLTPLQLQKDMQKLGRSQPPTTAGSTPQYFFWSILASCQGVLCPGSELWYIWASKWNQETISVSSGRSTWRSTTVSWCFMRNLNMIMISGSAALEVAGKVDTSAVFHQFTCHRRLNQLEANILTCSGSKDLWNVWWSIHDF